MPTEGRLSREEDERLMALSIIPLIPVFCLVVAYFAHLKSIGVISSFQDAFQYTLFALALWLATSFGIYEVVSSFKVKQSLSFRVKRWLSRTAFAAANVLYVYVLWSFFTLLFSSVLKLQYILILSLLTLSLTMLALLQNPKTRRLVKKLTREEN